MKNPKAFTAVEAMIVLVIIGLLLSMVIPACNACRNKDKNDHAAYAVWCKINRREDISFEQWRSARDSHLIGSGDSFQSIYISQ